MGHSNRKNKGSLVHQVQNVLDSKLKIGHSKYQDKKAGISNQFIYSWSTYRSYLKECCYFVKWCKQTYQCKTLEDCKPYIAVWMKQRSHLSAYTQKLDLCALAKLYGCDTEAFEIPTPARERKNIKRSRGIAKRDMHFKEENHEEFVRFCRATGLRRAELAALRGTALYQDSNGTYLHITSGSKGGRERYAPVISDIELVTRLCRQAGEQKVFDKIPSGADIHSYRGEYAVAVYEKYARPLEQLSGKEKYVCRNDRRGEVFDRAAMRIASNALGHNRISIIAGHYLYKHAE